VEAARHLAHLARAVLGMLGLICLALGLMA
jgi:hypothetical protein